MFNLINNTDDSGNAIILKFAVVACSFVHILLFHSVFKR